MASLNEIREKYPQYGDLSDTDLADKLYRNFYSDMPRADFNKRVGIEADPAAMRDKPVDWRQEALSLPSGLNEGIAVLAGAPADAINWMARLAGIPEPFGGSEGLKAGMNAVGMRTDIPAQTVGGKLGRRAMQEVGGAVPVMAGATLLQKTAQTAGPVVRSVVDALASQPKTQVAASAITGAGAETGSQLTGGHPLGEAAGMLAGVTFIPAVTATGDIVWQMIQPFRKAGQESIVGGALQRIGREGGENIQGALDDAIAQGPEIVPGSMPTTAQATQSASLTATERALKNNPTVGSRFDARSADQSAARRQALGEIIPEVPPGQGAQTAADAVTERRDQFQQATDALIGRAGAKVEGRAGSLPPQITPHEAGTTIRDEVARGLGHARTLRDRAALPKLDAALTAEGDVNTGHLVRFLDRMLSTEKRTAVRAALTETRGKLFVPDTDELDTSVGGLYETRKAINDIIDGKGENAVGRYAKDELIRFRDALDRAITRVAPEFKDYLKTYAGESRRLVDPFTRAEGVTPRVLQRDPYKSRYTAAPEKVAEAYWRAGAAGGRELKDVLAASPAGQEAFARHAATSLREYATKADGTIDANLWSKWMRDNGAILSEFPALRAQFNNAGGAQQTLDNLMGRQQRTIDDLERSAAGYLLKQNPEDAVLTVLNSKHSERLLAELVGQVRGDPRGLAGLRRAFIDAATRNAETTAVDVRGNYVMSPARIIDFLNDHKKEAARLFDAGHLDALKAIQRDVERANFSNTGNRVVGSNTTQNIVAGHLLNRMTMGMSSGFSALPQTVARPLQWLYRMPEQDIQTLLVDAMLDPKLARALVQKASAQNVDRVSNLLRQRASVTLGLSTIQAPQGRNERPSP